MRIRFDPAPLRQSQASGHVVRFVMGGLATVATALIAQVWGPKVGGLFLAWPAIFPAGVATLVRLHERAVPGGSGDRPRRAAVLEATGASIGAWGLAGFGLVVWLLLDRLPAWLTLLLATLAWALVSVGLWLLRKTRHAA